MTDRPPSTRMLFETCAATGQLHPEVVRDLIAARTEEDLHLDYKSGELLAQKNAPKLRSATAAFANADGGLLLLGIRDGDAGRDPWMVDGCVAVGGQTPLDWVASAIRKLAPYMHPFPKIGGIEVDGKYVVFIAISRSSTLVPCIEPGKGGIVHYLRFYGRSDAVPPYLLADLLHGRRQRPTFSFPEDVEIEEESRVIPTGDDHTAITASSGHQ